MAININAVGTSYPSFRIGTTGPTIHQGPTTPVGMVAGDIWIDTTLNTIKAYNGTSAEEYTGTR